MNDPTTETQSEKSKRGPYKTKAPTRGGARAGSGRPKGSTNKITPEEMLTDFKKTVGVSFHSFISQQIKKAACENNGELVSKYLLGFGKYLIQDKQEIDITSNGETVTPVVFDFSKVELVEWQK